jgi:hypothetical protein
MAHIAHGTRKHNQASKPHGAPAGTQNANRGRDEHVQGGKIEGTELLIPSEYIVQLAIKKQGPGAWQCNRNLSFK